MTSANDASLERVVNTRAYLQYDPWRRGSGQIGDSKMYYQPLMRANVCFNGWYLISLY